VARRRNPERDFGEARERLDRGDRLGALRSLDRARRGFARRGDVDGLQHVLDLAALVDATDERIAAERDNLEYAVKQNLRQATRTRAVREGQEWVDPYPDIEAPAARRTRVYLTRWVKLAIAFGVLVGVIALGGCIALGIIYSNDEVAVVVTNNRAETVKVRWCDAPDCEVKHESHELAPGGTAEFDFMSTEALAVLVVFDSSGARLGCFLVPARELWDNDVSTVRRDVSSAEPCPASG
jgi:hypothetical protein